MNFLDTRVRIRHPCPFCDFSAAFPDVQITQWCNQTNDVLHIVVPDPDRLPEVLAAASKALGVRDMFRDGRSALTMSRGCCWNTFASVTEAANDAGVWLVPPITYREGWETHRVLSPGRKVLKTFVEAVKKMGEIQVLAHRPQDELDTLRDVATLPVHLFDGLTDRQAHILVSALENGLLDVPARTRMGRVAKREGLSRSTYGEHLRKAERQLVRNSYPFLKLRDAHAKRVRSKKAAAMRPRTSRSAFAWSGGSSHGNSASKARKVWKPVPTPMSRHGSAGGPSAEPRSRRTIGSFSTVARS